MHDHQAKVSRVLGFNMQTILGLCLLGLSSSCLRPAEAAVPCLVILSSKPSYLPCLFYTWNISHTLFQGFT